MDYSERMVGEVVRRVPAGVHAATGWMEDDGAGGGPFRIELRVRRKGNRLDFDFSGTSPQAEGGINANRSIVRAACVYVLRCLCTDRVPMNEGVFRCLSLCTEPGSLVDPIAPAPVAGGNVETSQRLVDVALAALQGALPDRIPAASAGTMSNLSVGGVGFTFYETLPGGAGAGRGGEGASAIQTHMTNTRNTPIEAMERQYPLRIVSSTVRRGSGGKGRNAGGDGIVKEIEFLAPVTVTFFAERHRHGPEGIDGGGDGRPGRLSLCLAGGGSWRRLPAKGSHRLGRGDRLRIETPGGGACGAP
jgi:N-methylhydantoinase B